jgi:hypothetical protein
MGCRYEHKESFLKKLTSDQTGVVFENTITSNDTLNLHNYPLKYNGGGVAIGDINNDGLSDLFFTGNMVTSRLYLNRGDMKFEDITESAGVQTDRWATGASMVDINGNGHLDIYVSFASTENSPPEERANLLFVNNGDNTFTEAAGEYGIAGSDFTTHAAFLDYDRDGDLDLYLMNHSPGYFARYEPGREPSILSDQTSTSYDQLYRNNGDGSFTNVTRQAGILSEEGFGLGVAVSDINHDGWPDIYISNDLLTDDVLYINNQDGTFSDKTDEWLRHTSFAGMGTDIADFNNDGWPDILQVDMMPENYHERKRMSGGISYDHYREMQQKGFHYQYSINTLQLNNGKNNNGDVSFSEIARLAGVAYTHWSWSALFGDYDNDGQKDIMITNGMPKAVNDYDYLVNMDEANRFSTREARDKEKQKILNNLHGYELSNYIFRNEGNLTFSDKSEEWKFGEPGFSYGAAQADLDNDGDLDIVINNVNAQASIYRNDADRLNEYHYLSLKLKGSPANTQGIGAKIIINIGNKIQYQYHSPYRGYQSSVDNRIFFGLGNTERVDSLVVIWPDGRFQQLADLEADQTVTLNYEDAKEGDNRTFFWEDHVEVTPFSEITSASGIKFKHEENEFVDYNTQKLLPYQLSKLGPPLASGDVDGDGLDDLYIGGASGQAGVLYLQAENGAFQKADRLEPWSSDKDFEDIGATFLDADGDGDPDLYVASGGYEFSPASELLLDRLYLNDGSGTFIRDRSALPRMFTSSSCVKPADFDNDGDPDLFVGGRQMPGRYPSPAKSYLLRNDGGVFEDVTSEVAPELKEPGLITDAEWIDFDGDSDLDLVTTGEWMPIKFYLNEKGSLEEVTDSLGSSQTGWWFSLDAGDFDKDGDPDLVAGNLGLNYSYTTSENKKFEVLAADFDVNQSFDVFLVMNENGTRYPIYGKAKIGAAAPVINEKFHSYTSFAEATLEEIVGEDALEVAWHYQADTFTSVYIENKEGNSFTATPLPNEAQFSAVKDIISTDVDNDGNLDLILAGNMYSSEPETARNDAGTGLWLKGDGKGNFIPIPPYKSGFFAPLDVKGLELVTTPSHRYILVANNDDSLQVFKIR